MKNTLGIFSWFGYKIPIRQRLTMIRQAGFDASSVWWGQEEDPAIWNDLPRIIMDLGLVLDNIHVPFEQSNDLWSEDRASREGLVSRHVDWLDDCARVGIPRLVMHASFENGPVMNELGIESMRTIVQAAEERGIVIALENVRRVDCFEAVMRAIESPALRFCYDSSHDRLTGGKGDLLRTWGHRLAVTHFSDNDGVEDRHWLPHEGIIDWQRVARDFPIAAYTGCLNLEVVVKDDPPPPPQEYLARAFRELIWLVGLLQRKEST